MGFLYAATLETIEDQLIELANILLQFEKRLDEIEGQLNTIREQTQQEPAGEELC